CAATRAVVVEAGERRRAVGRQATGLGQEEGAGVDGLLAGGQRRGAVGPGELLGGLVPTVRRADVQGGLTTRAAPDLLELDRTAARGVRDRAHDDRVRRNVDRTA